MEFFQRSDLNLLALYGGSLGSCFWGSGPGPSRDRLLRRLVRHAYQHVSFYCSLFDRNGIRPADIRGLADLHKLPIISKKEMQRAAPGTLLADYARPGELLNLKTSGSTGRPFTIRRTQIEAWLIGLTRLRLMRELGLKRRDRRAFIGVVSANDTKTPFWFRLAKMSGYFNIKKLDLFQDPLKNARILQAYQPQILEGFPHALLQIGAASNRIQPGSLRPRFMTSTAEVLTGTMRSTLEQTFQAPLYNLYSSTEFGYMAYECKETHALHLLNRSGLIIEVLKNGRPAVEGEWGEITVTSLFSYAMPFIRFALGDLARQGKPVCLCGKPFATIEQVQGRMADCLMLPNQRIIHPYQITLLLEQKSFTWIRQYQIFQKREDQVLLSLVPFEQPSSGQLVLVRQALEVLLGKGIELDILVQSSIERPAGGKIRICRSLVYSAYDE